MTRTIAETVAAQQSRRTFCRNTGQVASLTILGASLGAIFEGCSTPTSPGTAPLLQVVSAQVVNNSVIVVIDASSPLSTVPSAVIVQSALGFFLVARSGQNTFTALTAICTHQTCTITEFEGQTYVCPCHGSQFSRSGQVISGPATTSLRQFATRFDGAVLTITT